MDERLRERVSLITGAGSGIGAAVARRFAAEGARVVLLDRAIERANAVAMEIAAAGGIAEARPLDVSRGDEVQAAIAGIVRDLGRIDVLVNVAGITLLTDT